jgi:hypothetical protein
MTLLRKPIYESRSRNMRLNTTVALGLTCVGLLWNGLLRAAVSYPTPPPWQAAQPRAA